MYIQERQLVPKSGRSEWDGERNFGVAPKNVLLKGYFCPNFRGRVEKVVRRHCVYFKSQPSFWKEVCLKKTGKKGNWYIAF